MVDSDFPCLRRLCFHECPTLEWFPHLPALDSLAVICCPKLRMLALPSVTRLRLATKWSPEILFAGCLPMLQDLDISELDDDSFVFPDSQILHSTKKLSIHYCKGLKSISGLGSLYSLQCLEIYNCRQLRISPSERLPPNLLDVDTHQSPFAKSWYQHQIWDGSGDHQMDLESEQEDDDYGVEALSMNSDSEQDEDSSFIEADFSDLNI